MTSSPNDIRFYRFKPDKAWSIGPDRKMLLVTCSSSKEHRKFFRDVEEAYSYELNYRARFKVNGCDCKKGLSKGKCYRGFLFVVENAVVGGCLFQWRLWGGVVNHFLGPIPDADFTQWWQDRHPHPCWSLQWVWIAKEFRRKKILASAWPLFRKIFGIRPTLDFFMEGPYSDDFENFLCKQGYHVSEDRNLNFTWIPSDISNFLD